MEIISDNQKETTAHKSETHHLNKLVVIPLLITTLALSMACSLFHSEKDESSYQQEVIGMLATQDDPEPAATEASGFAQEPEYQSRESQSPAVKPETQGVNEYSVSVQNFSCTCQENSGSVTQELRVSDDQLEIVEADGSLQTYEKTGENTYKRSWMGYYILVENGQDTKVDREESVVITLTDDGYIMEHYSGTDGSPCCLHTFTHAE
jgi:hypothetical protein